VYKLSLLAYRCLHGLAPAYLADVLHPVTDLPGRRRLRSASSLAVAVPSTRLRTVGDRAFPAAASRTWNSLPPEVMSSTTLSTFKPKPKTYLFSLSLPDPSLSLYSAVLCTIRFKFLINMIMIYYSNNLTKQRKATREAIRLNELVTIYVSHCSQSVIHS